MLHLTETRWYNHLGSVGFEFKGPPGPPTYRQRMDQRDPLKSIRAKMVSSLPCWSPISQCCIFKSALVTILEPVLRNEYSHISSSIDTVYHPLQPRERASCGMTINSHVTPTLPHSFRCVLFGSLFTSTILPLLRVRSLWRMFIRGDQCQCFIFSQVCH